MSVHDAEPGDIYTDEHGKLWRIISVCHEPTVDAEEVEGTLHDPNVPAQYPVAVGIVGPSAFRAEIRKARRSGGVGGYMWHGWKRIWRHDWRGKQPPMPEAEPAPVGPTN